MGKAASNLTGGTMTMATSTNFSTAFPVRPDAIAEPGAPATITCPNPQDAVHGR